MKGIIVGALAIALLLLTATTASAGYTYLSPVNPGSVAFTSYYSPAGTAYACRTCAGPRPVVVARPVVYGPACPVFVQRPVVAVPAAVYYPAPVMVAPRVFMPGQPVRNVVRGFCPY